MNKKPANVIRFPMHQAQDVKPAYANMVRISHMPSEMVLDFALKIAGASHAKVQAQVLMSPLSAKLFLRALGENISRYESAFGEIKIPGEEQLKEYAKLFQPPDEAEPPQEKDPTEE